MKNVFPLNIITEHPNRIVKHFIKTHWYENSPCLTLSQTLIIIYAMRFSDMLVTVWPVTTILHHHQSQVYFHWRFLQSVYGVSSA